MIANIGPAVHMDTQPASLAHLEKQEQVQQAVQEEKESTASGSSLPPNVDEYIPGEEPVSAGLYRQGTDENGNPKIIFDAPDEGEKAADKGEKAADAPEKEEAQKCTVNTDKVDAEIKKLKKEKASIEKQLAKAGNDPIQQRKLYRELQQIEGELKMKDNDSYRKQHAEYTQG